MIRIAIMYKNDQSKSFDMDYYENTHMPFVVQKYGPFGLQQIEIDKALHSTGKNPAPYIAIGYLTFSTEKAFYDAIKAQGQAIMDDLKNFTQIKPIIQISSTSIFYTNQIK